MKTKKEFIAEMKVEAADLRAERRRLERQSNSNYEDEEDYKFQSLQYLGEVNGVFKFMGWGYPPKSLTKNIEL